MKIPFLTQRTRGRTVACFLMHQLQLNSITLISALGILCSVQVFAAEKSPAKPAPVKSAPVVPGSFRIANRNITVEMPEFQGAIYTEPKGLRLRSGSRFSPDNGQTWQTLPMLPDFKADLPKGFRREAVTSLCDPEPGRFLTIVNALDTPGLDPNAVEPPIALETYYLRYRVSADGGMTWRFEEPIVQSGQFTPEHPFEDIWVGTNSLFLGDAGSIPIATKKGRILVPAQATVIGPDGKLLNPAGGYTYTEVRVLIGNWAGSNHIAWKKSVRVAGDPKLTTRGLIEPTLAEFKDGRILMVMRGSNGGKSDPEYKLPSYRWFSVSQDGGETWSTPEPWTYDDGQPFFSPSSMSTLIPHSSGRCFWVGNLTPENCQGNSPRFPVVIGEVNPRNLKLVRESVLLVDTERPGDKKLDRLDLSHFTFFEDRETHEIVLVYPRSHNAYKSQEWATVRIAVPGKK